MEVYDSIYRVLNSIISEKMSLFSAIKKNDICFNDKNRNRIISFCGLYLRNYEFIKYFTSKVLNLNNAKNEIYFGIFYIDLTFKKINDVEKTTEILKEFCLNENIVLSEENKDDFTLIIKERRSYQLKNVKVGTYEYFSIRYNLPLWIIKMLSNQYGVTEMIKIIREMAKMPRQFVIKNNLFFEDSDEINLDNFKIVEDGIYEYLPQTSLRKEPLVRDSKLIGLQMGEYELGKYLPDLKNKSVTCYLSKRTKDFFFILNKYYENNLINLFQKNEKDNYSDFILTKKKENSNIFSFTSSSDGLLAYIDRNQDLLIYYPESSSINEFRKAPDYGIIFNPSNLDDIILNQIEDLNNLACFIKKNGRLVYALDTIDLKETIIIIKKFLETHNEFTLEQEKIYFPQEQDNSIFYWTILKRK